MRKGKEKAIPCLTPLSLQPDYIDLRYFKLGIPWCNILCLTYQRFTVTPSGYKDVLIIQVKVVAKI